MLQLLISGISLIVTYFCGWLSKKFKLNKEFPIEFQNYLVGLICFAIIYFITQPTDSSELYAQIVATMGGSGFATLIYDTKKKIKEEEK